VKRSERSITFEFQSRKTLLFHGEFKRMVDKRIPVKVDDGRCYDLTITDKDTAIDVLKQICKIKRISNPTMEISEEDDLILIGEMQFHDELQEKYYMPHATVLNGSDGNNLRKLSVIGFLKQMNQSEERMKKLQVFHEMMERFSGEIFNHVTPSRFEILLVSSHRDHQSAFSCFS
jgi:hypothetical protein